MFQRGVWTSDYATIMSHLTTPGLKLTPEIRDNLLQSLGKMNNFLVQRDNLCESLLTRNQKMTDELSFTIDKYATKRPKDEGGMHTPVKRKKPLELPPAPMKKKAKVRYHLSCLS